VYLLDTNVLSERRKGAKADPGVVSFIDRQGDNLYLPVQVVGELRSGIEGLRLRSDVRQAQLLEDWLTVVIGEYADHVIDFTLPCAQVWGALMGVNDQHTVDRQIAAIALVYDLTIVTRNITHFQGTGVRLMNPFLADAQLSSPTT
jgi:predicted nucleic acid-binding protein